MRFYLGLGVLLVVACKSSDMVERQRAASEALRANLWGEVSTTFKGWLDQMVAKLPADVKKYPKVKSPLVDWRIETLEYDWQRPLKAVIARAKSTPFQGEFDAVFEFFDTMTKFWRKEVDFKDYMKAYENFRNKITDGSEGSRLALMLADFDRCFVHVEAFYGAQDMEGDDRAIYFFRHWQVAFEFPRDYHESVSDYLARLCKEKLADYCQDIPFEVMHFAVEKPYLQRVQRIVSGFIERYPDCPLNRIFQPFLAEVAQRLNSIGEFVEDPVLPNSISRAPFVGHVTVEVSRKSLSVNGEPYLEFSQGWQVAKGAYAGLERRLRPVMQRLEEERGPENLEVLVVSMDRGAPMGVVAEIVEIFRKHAPRVLNFGARRRSEGVARKTVVGRLEFREVPWSARRIEVPGLGMLRCRPIGQSTDAADLPKKVKVAAFIGTEKVVVGKLSGQRLEEVEGEKGLSALSGEPALLLVGQDVTYERFIRYFEPIFLICTDSDCKQVKNFSPEIEVQICAM